LPEAARMEQWLFTFDSATGEVCRVEKVDSVSGRTQELSEPEYAALESYLDAVAPEPAPPVCNVPALGSGSVATSSAYWQGVADCAALYRQHRFSGR